jgi:hypothetical protein
MAGLLTTEHMTSLQNTQPMTRELDPNELASNQLSKITSKDSPLMQLSATQGQQYGNSRGLLSSSISGEASQNAMIQNATPFALDDAGKYTNLHDRNMDWTNQFKMSDKQFGQAGMLQKDQQGFQAGENVLDRTHQSAMQQAEFGFRGTQNELDRALQKYLQTSNQTWQSGEADKDRSFQQMMQAYELGWRSGEASLDRALQQTLQQSQFAFQGSQAELDRQFQQTMQQTEQAWRATQNELDRSLQSALQQSDQAWRTGESEMDRQLQARMQEIDQIWRSSENESDRTLSKLLQGQQLSFQEQQAALDRMLSESMQSNDQSWKTGENELDRALQKLMQGQSLTQQETQAALDRALSERLQQTGIDADYTKMAKQAQYDIQKMGYAFDLDKYNVSSSYAAMTSQNTLNSINAILADPNLDPEAKKGAIDNIVQVANANLAWASTFYGLSLPSITQPGGTQTTISPDTSYTNPTPTPTAPTTFNRDAMSKYMTDLAKSYGYTPNVDEIENAIREAERNGWTNEQAEAWVVEQLKANGTIQ